MSKKMSNAPIFFAVVQVKFNAVLPLDQYVASIQDTFRRRGYSDYEQAGLVNINFAIGGQPAQVMPTVTQQHKFSNEEKTSCFTLENVGLTYTTTEYSVFEEVLAEFLSALKTVSDQVGALSFTERLGIRFLDAVCPREGETLAHYLSASMLGLSSSFAERQLVHSISETRTKVGETSLISRAVILNQESKGPALPPEFSSVTLKMGERFQAISGVYAIIDTDCFAEERQKFSLEYIDSRLTYLHDQMDKSFKLTVTPHALQVWK